MGIYKHMEIRQIEEKDIETAMKIRIDVVDDYDNNVIPFWKKMGFIKMRKDELSWGKKLHLSLSWKNF